MRRFVPLLPRGGGSARTCIPLPRSSRGAGRRHLRDDREAAHRREDLAVGPATCSKRALAAGTGKVQAYVDLHRAVFESTNMAHAWRARTLGCLGYLDNLDLVAVAPDGRLAAFCIGWLSPVSGTIGQIEPFGVGRELREAGLGRAILLENVRRLASLGACRVLVEMDTYRSPALDLYGSAGFKPIRDVHVYRKNYATE